MIAPDYPREIAEALGRLGLKALLEALGLRGRKEGDAYKILCPAHAENSASCSVRIGADGTPVAFCHACGFAGNVHQLTAIVRGYKMPNEFRRVLLEEAPIAGLWHIVDALERRPGGAARPSPSTPPARPQPKLASPLLSAADYAEVAGKVADLSGPLRAQPDASAYLDVRGIRADAEAREVFALPEPAAQLALFATLARHFGVEVLALAGLANDAGNSFRAAAWRLCFQWRDRSGRTVAIQRRTLGPPPGDCPKYLFPKGRPMPEEPYGAEYYDDARASYALGGQTPAIVVCEGAADSLAAIALNRREPRPSARIVLGIPSANSWRKEWREYGRDLDVYIALDDDPAGDRGADRIAADLVGVARRVFRELPPIGCIDMGASLQSRLA